MTMDDCPSMSTHFYPADRACYQHTTKETPWNQAQSLCSGLGEGWSLATFESEAELEHVQSVLTGTAGKIGYGLMDEHQNGSLKKN